jgi:hypothetical protein
MTPFSEQQCKSSFVQNYTLSHEKQTFRNHLLFSFLTLVYGINCCCIDCHQHFHAVLLLSTFWLFVSFCFSHDNRLILGEAVTNETIEDSTIKVYPDLTSKSQHLSTRKWCWSESRSIFNSYSSCFRKLNEKPLMFLSFSFLQNNWIESFPNSSSDDIIIIIVINCHHDWLLLDQQ